MSDDIKRIDIAEFREFGFLQEANRQFFHPLGLALEIVQEECGTCGGDGVVRQEEGTPVTCIPCGGVGVIERLGGIWDYRDDPEGMMFGDPSSADPAVRNYGLDPVKARRVEQELESHGDARMALFRNLIQPIPMPK